MKKNLFAKTLKTVAEKGVKIGINRKSQKGSFNTKPITRKISLHWDNLRDGYYIAFQTNGGSVRCYNI